MAPNKSIACLFEILNRLANLRYVDFRDGASVVDRSARESKFVSHERNDIRTWDEAALGFVVKRDDAGVALPVKCDEHIGLLGDCGRYRRRGVVR